MKLIRKAMFAGAIGGLIGVAVFHAIEPLLNWMCK